MRLGDAGRRIVRVHHPITEENTMNTNTNTTAFEGAVR